LLAWGRADGVAVFCLDPQRAIPGDYLDMAAGGFDGLLMEGRSG
jgi:hypothetical protein